MIPVRDVIPSRTAPGVTVLLVAALVAALAWPAAREWWLPWVANAAVLWLFGGTVEDRLGHGRFAVFSAACLALAAAAPLALERTVAVPVAVSGGLAGVSAAYFLMFPRSRILTFIPVIVGVDLTDVPAWIVCGLWAFVQVATIWARVSSATPPGPLAVLASLVAGAAAGTVGWLVLRRPERMRVDWWDLPGK
jgi:membrane associated rhomboid family serine protease